MTENLLLFNRLKSYFTKNFLVDFKKWVVAQNNRIVQEMENAKVYEKKKAIQGNFFDEYNYAIRAILRKDDTMLEHCLIDLSVIKPDVSKIDLQAFRKTLLREEGKISLNYISLKESASAPEIRNVLIGGFVIQYRALIRFCKFMPCSEQEVKQDLFYLFEHQGLNKFSLFAFQRFVDYWIASFTFQTERPEFPNIGFLIQKCKEYQNEIDIVRGNVEYLLSAE